MAILLCTEAIRANLARCPGWHLNGNQIECTREFAGFVEAIAFVNKLVEPAEAAGHHPDLAISYNKVTIALTTHDAGGLTDADFAMAAAISDL
ncbi:Pterin-4a-carbinolamine dehydratase [Rubidibacter lacunae KORDI 51-2]|uniref:4a-hydroxytetrahydrobiopterin dehydratase n=1 Tax=Rubidibacter lacunae KORDI 51-2 TaxID=582515 RepID=U5DG55_9CHRO|nr:4a-hydroxytetrahydrobiopterin dehydratase [Rubidibacter lacunae]ERN40247.1 Pterin-4a-carbinolamine dehydratase [Rubidibacter lacunae KORDI 51-2]